ncbi:MAG: hypothetical protein KDD89_01145 [Anaerolineales bacterium]|nr:hypothetical protein [Anaerolineales bacterium]
MRNASKWNTVLNITVPLLLTLVGSFVVLEIGLRILYQLIPLEVCASDPIIGNYYCQPYFEYDEPVEIAYKYVPGLKLEGLWDPANPYLGDAGRETRPSDRTEPFLFRLETDEMGFPNAQYEWQDEYDIVLTGDSFTIRTAPETYIEQLAANTGKDILTLGAPSWTTLNEVTAVEKFGLDKNPDWVVLLYFEGNDLLNIQQYLEKQASGLSWKAYDMQGVPWYRRLVMYHMMRYWLGLLEPEPGHDQPIRYRYPVAASTEVGSVETVFKDIHLLPISADYDTIANSDEFAAIQNALLGLKAQVEAQDGRFLLVYIPSKEHIYWSRIWDEVDVNNILERTVTVSLSEGDHGRLEWEPRYLDYDTFNANHNAQERVMTDFATANGFDYLNLTPLLWQATIEQGEMYHYGDPHWNQAGNNLVADALQAYLESAEQ